MADSAANFDPEPALVLRPSKLKWMVVAASCLLFIAPIGLMISAGAAFTWVSWLIFGFVGFLVVGFFGFGFLVAVGMLIWPGNRLAIDDDGFTLWSFGRKLRIAWRDTYGIYSGAGGMICTVAVDLPTVRLIELPFGYGRSSAELIRVMNERRARADAREGFDAVRQERNRRDAELWGFW